MSSFDTYCTLRYDFVPASLDIDAPGLIKVLPNNGILVERHNVLNSDGVHFRGKLDNEVKETEYVLLYNAAAAEFVLHKVRAGQAKNAQCKQRPDSRTRHVRK